METTESKKTFKQLLAEVFDEDFSTNSPRWTNYLDLVIIVMIVLSTVSVFLGTFPQSPGFTRGLKVFDWFVQIFFTVEVSLRIWAADEIDDKYRNFKGRVRYCLSFYGLIDFLATYPVWLGLICPSLIPIGIIQSFRVLRVARLFRVFLYFKAFRFLSTAISSKKKEILVSLEFIMVVTIVLSFILYLVEHDSNPVMIKDGWHSIVWAFAKYLGDPGKIADTPLVTTAGHIIAFLVGVMGVAIFVVPIGFLSAGFQEAVEKDKHNAELEEYREKISRSFRRTGNKSFKGYLDEHADIVDERFKTLNFVPQRMPVSKLQVRQGLTLDNVIETCKESKEFRLKNLSAALSDEELAPDRFIVEHFPLNREYGCYKPRKSNVTIVCPSSLDEVGIGWFTYYLAKMGGFNYISHEIKDDSDGEDSYYNLSPKPSESAEKRREEFLKDLTADESVKWVIIFVTHVKNSDNTVDFHFSAARKNGLDCTVEDLDTYKRFTERFTDLMKREFELDTVAPSGRHPLLKKNLGYEIRKRRPGTNVFVLRPSSELMNFNTHKLAIAYRMALLISEQFDNGRGMTADDCADFKKGGLGFAEKKSDDKDRKKLDNKK